MDLKSFKLGTNIWIVAGTIVFLGFAYFMYLNYYITGKENRIISTRFRVLDQIGDNLDKKLVPCPKYLANNFGNLNYAAIMNGGFNLFFKSLTKPSRLSILSFLFLTFELSFIIMVFIDSYFSLSLLVRLFQMRVGISCQ